MTAPLIPDAAVTAAVPTAAASGLDDHAAWVRMLEDDAEIEQLLQAVRDRHTMDISGAGLSSLTRALGMVEMLRIELRLCRNYVGGL